MHVRMHLCSTNTGQVAERLRGGLQIPVNVSSSLTLTSIHGLRVGTVKTLACHARDEGIVTPAGRQNMPPWLNGRALVCGTRYSGSIPLGGTIYGLTAQISVLE
jgi:hypothetical protein